MGQPKPWLDAGGEPLLHRIARLVLEACPVVVVVGSVHVRMTTQVAVGVLVEETEVLLPVKTSVPESGSVLEPEVKVVAEVVMCQPAPLPVRSLTVST